MGFAYTGGLILFQKIIEKSRYSKEFEEANRELEEEEEMKSAKDEKPVEEVKVEDIDESEIGIIDSEKELIRKALTKANGNRKEAAEILGLSERTIYRKMKEYDL
jgi:transcriptional regulator with PAS, ATPase and Fis domain